MKTRMIVGIMIVGIVILSQMPYTFSAYKDEKSTEQASHLVGLYQCINDYRYRTGDFPKNLHVILEEYPDLFSSSREYKNRVSFWSYTPIGEGDVLVTVRNEFPHPDVVLTKNGTIKKLWKPGAFKGFFRRICS